MKSEAAKQIADQALQQLAESLGQGRSDALTRYLAALAKFHRYSFGNVLMIASQRPDATQVAGFNAWRQLGRFVKKGEKGIIIIAPMLIRKDDDANPGADDAKPDRILRFRAVYVFDVAQTDGDALPEPSRVSGDPSRHLAGLRTAITGRGIALDDQDVPPSALGVSRGGRISVRAGLSPAEEFAVLVHEFAHELLHRGDDRPASNTVRETEAEAVAFVVSEAVGLDAADASRDYIQLYDGDAEMLAASLDRIQRTAAAIIGELLAEPIN